MVKNLTEYGAFVDLGGIDGLLHITDMSWGRLTHPRDLVNVGDQIQVKVLKFDKDKQRVSLGFKQLTPDPWLDAAHRYPGRRARRRTRDQRHRLRRVRRTGTGHRRPGSRQRDDLVQAHEASVEAGQCRRPGGMRGAERESTGTAYFAGHAAAGAESLGTPARKYPVGATVEGRVRNLTDFGAFIEIEDGIDGLVHVSNLSWTKRVKHPSEVLKKGDRVKAIVLAIEPDKRRLSLGVKQLQPDVWETFFETHHVGDVVHGKVLRVASSARSSRSPKASKASATTPKRWMATASR